jgi:hypothetical protein
MRVDLQKTRCIIFRLEGDPHFPSETAFWYALKRELQSQGHDVIKRLMTRDGHLVSEGVYYIRDRKCKWCLEDPMRDIDAIHQTYNAYGVITLLRHYWENIPE